MSGYERTSTPDLIAFGRVVGTPLTRAIADRLAAYERIVAGLIDAGEPIADYAGQCGCCGMGQPRHGSDWQHAADCPWWLAQQTGGDQ